MCGICGVATGDGAPGSREIVERMNEHLRHRGPDGDGFLFRPGVALAMRRLAVIDLETGDQPIANEDETVWIVFNGEIYNFPELREDLEKRGHRFRTRTDTECVVHLYEEYGGDLVHHLRGMFAFALWDDKHKRLLIARDRFGKKPLFYTQQNGSLIFSSELGSLLQALPSRPTVDLQAIDSYLSLQYIPEPHTPFAEVHKLLPAHRLIWEAGSLRLDRYWELEYLPKWTDSEDDLIAELQERLREAVRIRMISDVPLGAHLSGGIDSSIVVALMAESSDLPIQTFSVGFEEGAFSELRFAREVADRYGTDHQEFVLSYGEVQATLEKLLSHFGEPFADPSALPLYLLSQITREHVTVALNGDGGDEAFGGYQRYWLDPWANRYARLPGWLNRRLVPSLASLLRDESDRPVGAGLVNGLKRLGQLPDIDARASILRWGSYFSPAFKSRLWREEFRETLNLNRAEEYLIEHFGSASAESFMDRTISVDNRTYLPGALLVKADRMTMANSLEGRSPFLDHEFASWAARLPENLKVRGRTGKYLLRKAFEGQLPSSVRARGKQGFGIPVGAWFRGPQAGWARDLLIGSDGPTGRWFNVDVVESLLDDHISGREDHGKRIWALVVLELWHRSFLRIGSKP